MFKIIYNIVIYFTLIFSLYYVILATFAFRKKKSNNIKGKINHFAILIAARNEEKVIAELIKSLKNQNYDEDSFKIYVIINNCTDNTLNVARENGAEIINCEQNINCKGEALRYAFEYLKGDRSIDAYLIFDADNVVHPDFLTHMNASLNNGFKVAQGMRETKNLGKSWISSSYAIYYYLQNFFISKARKNVGLSTTINGTGFMVKKELLDTMGFNTKTLTEDIEFSALCILNKIKIDFVEEAITYDEQPISFRVSWNQRMRWTKGTLQCLKLYAFKLIKNFFKTFSISNIDVLFLYMAPLLQIISFAVILIDIVIQLVNLEFLQFINIYFYKNAASMLISYLIVIISSTFVVLYNKHKIKEALSGIVLFVVFIFSWLPINIVCIFKRKVVWKSIKHDSTISIKELMKK